MTEQVQTPNEAQSQVISPRTRWSWLAFSALLGTVIAWVWNYEVMDPIAKNFQQWVVGTTTPTGFGVAAFLSLVSGASMIVTA